MLKDAGLSRWLLARPNSNVSSASKPIRFALRKDKPGPRSTYTLRYFTRDTETNRLF